MRSIGLLILLCISSSALAQELIRSATQPSTAPSELFYTDVPPHPFSLILGRPTDDSITVSVCLAIDADARIVYADQATPWMKLSAGVARHVLIEHLKPNQSYAYHVEWRTPKLTERSPTYAFRTARSVGDAFTFTLTADSHLDFLTSPDVYLKTLRAIESDKPDFHIDLGDTFMTDKRREAYKSSAAQYDAQRYYFSRFAHSTPLFLVLGNHDGEIGWASKPAGDGMADWSLAMRMARFANPLPDAFYSAGPKQNYYAWEWGDALLIVLDPFWAQTARLRGQDPDLWQRTIGREQYDWLTRTLARSHARHKFVFIHHLVGGLDKESRGGAKAALLYEWGGRGADGVDQFAAHRPGWAMPIHDLLRKHNVEIVFHGHDHLYAKESLDGILYQAVPQPGHLRPGIGNVDDYGYPRAAARIGSGYLRVRVAGDRATITFIRVQGDRLIDDASYDFPSN